MKTKLNFLALLISKTLLLNCQTQKEALLTQHEQIPKPIQDQAFELASKIDFYYYHRLDSSNRILIKEGAPLCEANAMVYGDQIQKSLGVPVKILQINLNTPSYKNYCAYPQTYAWHTVATLQGEDGVQYVIDPFSQEKAMPLEIFIKEYVKKDCINYTLDQLVDIAESVNGTAVITGTDSFQDFMLGQKDAYNKNTLTPIPIVNYDYKWTYEEHNSLVTNAFIYLNEKSVEIYEKVDYVIYGIVPDTLPKDKWIKAYSWVRPKSSDTDSPKWRSDIQDIEATELVTRETFKIE